MIYGNRNDYNCFFRLFETSHAKQSVRAAAAVVVVVVALQSCFVVTLKGHRCWEPTSGTQRMIEADNPFLLL